MGNTLHREHLSVTNDPVAADLDSRENEFWRLS